jgi:tellurite resistance protein
MTQAVQDALVSLMVVAAWADAPLSETELARIEGLIARLPVFEGYDFDALERVANQCADKINSDGSVEGVLDAAVAALPQRLQDTAYYCAVEVASVDLQLAQEELRLLEMIRDRLELDRLVTAAIERTAKARLRRA